MFTRIMISLGWLGIAAGICYFIFQDRSSAVDAEQYTSVSRQIFLISASVLGAGYVLKYLARALGIGRYSRCQTCKKRIDKGEMFCFDHRRETIWNAQERHRIGGAGVIRNHTTKH